MPVKKWNKDQLAFQCPFCYNKWKKNGEPYKNGIFKYHFHGDAGKDPDRNYGIRVPHCSTEARAYWKLPTFQFELIGNNMIF